ncbi:unnamed protein product [Alopecurus aequalis]
MSQTASRAEVSMDSPASSCVSSDEEEKSMVVAGCPQCLMYVMLLESEEEEKQPKCPRCKSPVLVHFHKYSDTKNKA